jgi:hypothetical protein
MATTATGTTAPAASVGVRRELGRYHVAEGERVIHGPADPRSRPFSC